MMAKKGVVAPRTTQSETETSETETLVSSKPTQSSVTNTILFESSLDIAGADRLRQQLLVVLREQSPVVLDAANVERVDTAALQVLTAFFKDADAANITVQWKQTSGALKNAARLLGLGSSLHLEPT
jgi:phospholipid transport system transporter-binding protein